MKSTGLSTRIIQLLGALLVLFSLFLTVAFLQDETLPRDRAIMGMTCGFILIWIVLGGLLNLKFRTSIQQRVRAIPLRWQLKFILFCTLLALLEEAVTTTMTNLAPVFGVKVGEAYITASANYLDVVLFHSVIVFVPMFIVWSWLLGRWDFSPPAVFLLFGLQGILAEGLSFGFSPIGTGFWVYVYGLMIYLPAYSLPTERGTNPVRWYHYPIVTVLPFLTSIPVALVVINLHPTSIHF